MRHDLRAELDFAVEITRGAGELTLRYFQQGIEACWKPDRSPVTEADLEAEKLLRRRIEERFPRDGILGEEHGEKPSESGRRWIVDPIDGTKSFVQGVPLYGVLVALEIDREAVLGCIGLPATDEIIFAARGHGCFWNDAPARVSATTALEDACVCYTAAALFGQSWTRGEEMRRSLSGDARIMRGWGDAYGYALVATGRADVMLDPTLKPWDIGPLAPVVEEAGGRFSDWRGVRGTDVASGLATNGHLHETMLERVSAAGEKIVHK